MTVLIVEDEVIAAHYLKQIVHKAGLSVIGTVQTGKEAIALAKNKKPELILMDIMLKDNISGVDAAVEICHFLKHVQIVFLTAYTEEGMIETAIEANTAGYFLKPYNKEEIIVNLKILAAKKEASSLQNTSKTLTQSSSILQLYGNYSYHLENKRLYKNNQEIYLSNNERRVLECLCANPHAILDFETIIEYVWLENKPQQRLRSLVGRLRKKTSYELLTNVNKYGYGITLPTEDESY